MNIPIAALGTDTLADMDHSKGEVSRDGEPVFDRPFMGTTETARNGQ